MVKLFLIKSSDKIERSARPWSEGGVHCQKAKAHPVVPKERPHLYSPKLSPGYISKNY